MAKKIPMQAEYKQQYDSLPPEQRATVDKMRERIQGVIDLFGEDSDVGERLMWGVGESLWDDVKKMIAGALVKPADDQIWSKVYGAIQGVQALEAVVFSVVPRPEEEGEEEEPEPAPAAPATPAPDKDIFG